jgi:hypothetical protein
LRTLFVTSSSDCIRDLELLKLAADNDSADDTEKEAAGEKALGLVVDDWHTRLQCQMSYSKEQAAVRWSDVEVHRMT